MKDRSDDPSHHERALLPRNYISLLPIYCLRSIFIDYFPIDNPCDDKNAIILPGSKNCLIYHNEAKHWNEAARVCESEGGSLYMLDDVDVTQESLRDCLWSAPSGNLNFWIGTTSKWSPQWMWVNGGLQRCIHCI